MSQSGARKRSSAFEFEPTPAISAARSHKRFVSCPVCKSDHARYLFHRTGVRFVQCAACSMVYVNPAPEHAESNYFDTDRTRESVGAREWDLALRDFAALVTQVAEDFHRAMGTPLRRALSLGRFSREFASLPESEQIGLEVAEIGDDMFSRLTASSDIDWAKPALDRQPQVVLLLEVLEACSDPAAVLAKLVAAAPPSTLFVVTYTNTESLPARITRRHWAPFFDYKTAFFSTGNLATLMSSVGLVLKGQRAMPVTHTAKYVANRISRGSLLARMAAATPLGELSMPVRAGNRVAMFGKPDRAENAREKLSIILPVFNEVRYAGQVIDAVLAKSLDIDKEVIIVESNSTDGTRGVVRGYEGRPGVRVVYEDRPRGKGHAVRTGLAHVTGTIVLIQDADFEYDIDDYEALLEPILRRKTNFVLGSRSLGLDDWKVRKYDATPIRGFALNFAQVMFAKTYGALYQQRVTDVNTMFKVFRTECLDGMSLHSNGFELDIELVCKLARNGNSPMEVPVNYVARGFEDGKKIRFWRDAIPSYAAIFRYRFGR